MFGLRCCRLCRVNIGSNEPIRKLQGGRIWDFAAGALAVEEAGGVVTRLNGAGIDWRCIDMDILCASSTAIAEEALRLTAGLKQCQNDYES